jgi:hypothetical protein
MNIGPLVAETNAACLRPYYFIINKCILVKLIRLYGRVAIISPGQYHSTARHGRDRPVLVTDGTVSAAVEAEDDESAIEVREDGIGLKVADG